MFIMLACSQRALILVLEYVGNFGVRLPPGYGRHGVSVHCMCVQILSFYVTTWTTRSKRRPTCSAQLHLPAHDLFWAKLRVQLHLPPLRSLDLLISPGTLSALHPQAWTYIYRPMPEGSYRVQSPGFPNIVCWNCFFNCLILYVV